MPVTLEKSINVLNHHFIFLSPSTLFSPPVLSLNLNHFTCKTRQREIYMEKWRFKGNDRLAKSSSGATVRGVLDMVKQNLNPDDDRQLLSLGNGDPSVFPSFQTSSLAVDAIVDALRSFNFNCYSPNVGIPPARKAVAEYLSRDLPYQLSEEDVFLTVGCTQAMEVVLSSISRVGANILLPRPGFPNYEAYCAYIGLEVRHFDLIPEKGWEVDLDALEALADQNTVAMLVINPGNPCGSVYSYDHLYKVAETARKLGILVIADEVYSHLTFGSKPFVPMGVFGSVAPIITLGSISKRWVVPGWRLGWLVITDTQGILHSSGVVDSVKGFLNITSDPATFIQGAIPHILQKTTEEFFSRIIDVLRKDADICYEKVNEISCISCPNKPEGSMFVMVKLDLSLLDDICDDLDFCIKLAREEKVIVLPGMAVGLKNWLRITFSAEPLALEEALERMKSFCQRHAKK